MRLPGLAIDRSGLDTKGHWDYPSSYKVFEYERKGKKRFGFYVTDGFLGIPTDWRFRFKTKKAAREACMKMVMKITPPSFEDRMLEYLKSIGRPVKITWLAYALHTSRMHAVNVVSKLKKRGLIETEVRRTKDNEKCLHVRAL